LRYLAQGRIGLVREASTEKMTLSRIAPHLAEPLPFLFPTYKGSDWVRWKLRIGVKLYDWLCGKSNLGSSSGMYADEMLQRLPGLEPTKLTGGVRYFDGLTCDARLVLDSLSSAAKHGARALNYVSLVSADRDGDAWKCTLCDEATSQDLVARARVVINAAGAWAQKFPLSKVHLRLTKGVHVIVDRTRLPAPEAVVMTEGKRILFAIPWGERVILGTTDTDYDGPIENPQCDEKDLAYVLRIVNQTFPAAKLGRDDVISAWAGLRPLIADPNGKPSDVSREHRIIVDEKGWIDVAGGKLTTYRLMAQQAVDRTMALLGRPKAQSQTAKVPLLEGLEKSYSGVVPPAVSREAVEHFCRQEWARHLDDVMIRRTGWRFYHRLHLAIARQAAEWMAASLGWSADDTAAEFERYRRMTEPLAPTWEPAKGGTGFQPVFAAE
jgi:glycerol-3-phosphate dehydrogenase